MMRTFGLRQAILLPARRPGCSYPQLCPQMWIRRRRLATPLHPAPGSTPLWSGGRAPVAGRWKDPRECGIGRARQEVILRRRCRCRTREDTFRERRDERMSACITPCHVAKRMHGRPGGSRPPEFLPLWRRLFRVLRERDGAGAAGPPRSGAANRSIFAKRTGFP